MCSLEDQISAVRDRIANSTVYYCVLMLPNDVASKDHTEFANTLGLLDRAYFAPAREKSNAALVTMVIRRIYYWTRMELS